MNAVEQMQIKDALEDLEDAADYIRCVHHEHHLADTMDKTYETLAMLIERIKR